MKKQFNLQDWLKDKSQKVETRDGRPARIICTDAKADDGACIIALIPGYGGEEAYQFFPDGRAFSSKSSDEDCADLFLVTPEPEMSDFEAGLFSAFSDGWQQYLNGEEVDMEQWAKAHSEELLSLARKQIQPEIDAEIEKAYKTADEVQYRKCREEALKDLPRWKKEDSFETEGTFIGIKGKEYFVVKDGYSVPMTELLTKLPGFKEDEE